MGAPGRPRAPAAARKPDGLLAARLSGSLAGLGGRWGRRGRLPGRLDGRAVLSGSGGLSPLPCVPCRGRGCRWRGRSARPRGTG
jgi:hypothetical protein